MSKEDRTIKIFLSYAREDENKVETIYDQLVEAGFSPWVDKRNILPGERWGHSINQAIKHCDIFLLFLSMNSINKRGTIRKELRVALKMWQEMLDSDIFLIPVRLEPCDVPQKLAKFQWVNLYEATGFTVLKRAIYEGIKRRKPGYEAATSEKTAGQHLREQPRQPPYVPIPFRAEERETRTEVVDILKGSPPIQTVKPKRRLFGRKPGGGTNQGP